MSKLIKKLQRISENAVPPMGFRAASASPVQKMILIAMTGQIKAKAGTTPADFEADAMLVNSQNLKAELKNIKRYSAKPSNGMPVGIWFESVAEVDAGELSDAGIDFLVFTASEAPAALLQKDIGKVVVIDLKDDDGLIYTLDQLPVDALLIDFRVSLGILNILQLMNCQRIAGLTGKPLLIATQQKLDAEDIKGLWEAGVNGIIIETGEESRQNLDTIYRVIKDLPPISRKPKKRNVILSNGAHGNIAEEDEDL